jgi:hypothetical protein
VEKPNETSGLRGCTPNGRPISDVLGTVDPQELLKIIKAPDHRPLSIERLGNEPLRQLTVTARLISHETAGYKTLSHIEIKE